MESLQSGWQVSMRLESTRGSFRVRCALYRLLVRARRTRCCSILEASA